MSTVLVQATPGTFPEGFCPTGPTALQQLYNEIIARTVFSLAADKAFYNYGDTAPSPENRVFPWFRTVDLKWYDYVATGLGLWVAKYHVPAQDGPTLWWDASEALLWAYDGGDGVDPSTTPPTVTTGSFWQRNTLYDGRSPMGIGSIPNANPAKSLAVGEAYGEGAHTQSVEEVGPHVHPLVPRDQMEPSGGGDIDGIYVGGTGSPSIGTLSAGPNVYAATQQAMPVIHPVLGMIAAKRTIRAYWTVAP